MSKTYDLIVHGGIVVNHDGEGAADVGIVDGRIAQVGDLGQADAGQRIDATGLHVLPGVIDSQVHFREPGLEHKEDLQAGMDGAALGGVTTIFEMPNTNPSTTTAATLSPADVKSSSAMALSVGAASASTGASFTALTVTDAVSVAVEYALVPPGAVVSA